MLRCPDGPTLPSAIKDCPLTLTQRWLMLVLITECATLVHSALRRLHAAVQPTADALSTRWQIYYPFSLRNPNEHRYFILKMYRIAIAQQKKINNQFGLMKKFLRSESATNNPSSDCDRQNHTKPRHQYTYLL